MWLRFWPRFGCFFAWLWIAWRWLGGFLVRIPWRILPCWRVTGLRIRTLRRIRLGLRARLRVRAIRVRTWCVCRCACGHHTRPAKNSGFRCGRYGRCPVVHGNVEFAIASSTLLLLCLDRRRLSMCLARNCRFRRGWSRGGSPVPPVVAHAIGRGVVVRDCGVVRVVDYGGVDVGHRGVVPIDIPLPLATIEALTRIPVTVINAAVEAHAGCPITGIPSI